MATKTRKQDIMILGAAAAGGVGAGIVAKQLIPSLGLPASISPFIVPALGAALAIMVKEPIVKGIGLGMIAAGVPTMLSGLGINIGEPLMLSGAPNVYFSRNDKQEVNAPYMSVADPYMSVAAPGYDASNAFVPGSDPIM